MIKKPLIIVHGEPNSTFSEILFRSLRTKKFKKPIIIIGSKQLLELQAKKLKIKVKLYQINKNVIGIEKLSTNKIYIVNVNINFNKIFDKISNRSNNYITKCFEVAFDLIIKKKALALINGPISKLHFLKKKHPGMTEFIAKKVSNKIKPVMLIYNKHLSVSPVTTHIPIKLVSKVLTKNNIINNIFKIHSFYKKYNNKNAKFAVLGLNPHCETTLNQSEEKKIIIPAIKYLIKKKINVKGPYSTDTFFLDKNVKKFDVVIGMYHDQVITPLKTLFKFNAINLTLGLPFLRVSPDHGPNIEMMGKRKSITDSLISIIDFFNRIK